ncbi:MAG: hypothetical protein KF889_11430 [Alphaproteobacteria bacterium]|nr:hypothetical protein [Alphaproteobacteria bacterium]MCW5739398.1 hypothetical protein [Alphaproteobacteria bacterium]
MSARTGRLLAMPSGAAYPFISEHLMLKFGLAVRSAYRLFVSYPQFDLPGVDSGVLNQQIEKAARERIQVDPFPRPGDDFPGPWLTEIRHDLRFPAPGLVAVLSSIYLQHDGLRPTNVSAGMLVDLRAGGCGDRLPILRGGIRPERCAAGRDPLCQAEGHHPP